MPLASIKDQIALVTHFVNSAIRAESRGDHAAVADFLEEVSKNALEGANLAKAIASGNSETP